MISLKDELKDVKYAAIAGHVNPDGDAVGSSLGLWLYIRDNFPEIDCSLYLGEYPDVLQSMPGIENVQHRVDEKKPCDIFFVLDCAEEKRLGEAACLLKIAKRTICIDHHVSNVGICDVNYVDPLASSTSELICRILNSDRIGREAATALYMGIVHDTGVFRHSCTSPDTMITAAMLMKKGINASAIINKTYYDNTYLQNQILGRALLESARMMDGRVIYSVLRKKTLEFYGVEKKDLGGIIAFLMGTVGVEVAIFMYELSPQCYKVSLRSRELVDVSEIASYFGGGGHVRAAGCTMQGSYHDVLNNLSRHIDAQLKAAEESEEE